MESFCHATLLCEASGLDHFVDELDDRALFHDVIPETSLGILVKGHYDKYGQSTAIETLKTNHDPCCMYAIWKVTFGALADASGWGDDPSLARASLLSW